MIFPNNVWPIGPDKPNIFKSVNIFKNVCFDLISIENCSFTVLYILTVFQKDKPKRYFKIQLSRTYLYKQVFSVTRMKHCRLFLDKIFAYIIKYLKLIIAKEIESKQHYN